MAIKYTITASVDGVVQMRSCATAICLPILSRHAQKWNSKIPPNIMVVEAVITFAAISYSEAETDQIQILSNSRQYPWLLQNLRNTGLISMMTDVTDWSPGAYFTSFPDRLCPQFARLGNLSSTVYLYDHRKRGFLPLCVCSDCYCPSSGKSRIPHN